METHLMVVLHLVLWLLCSSTRAQAPQDPIKDFCRRYGHQTAVIDGKMYIDGGWVYANPISKNPVPTMNQGLIYSDLDVLEQNFPKQYTNLTKNSTVPDVAGGVLWADDINKVFWLYGGEYSAAPSTFQLWGYDTILNQWNVSSGGSSTNSPIQRVSYGSGTTLGKRGYYYGGYLNSLTNPLWSGEPFATSFLISLDMDTGLMYNNTGYDGIGRAEGFMTSIPASAEGMLVYFGGVSYPHGNTTKVAMPMNQILLYDVADARWYSQTTTGDIPPNRRNFCAGASWPVDQSSYNIYIYGGFGFGENITGFDDVWILSMPTFAWTKWFPDKPGVSRPHGLLTCNVIDKAQMIIMGGNFTNDTDCDTPNVGGQHNLNLGQQNPEGKKWYEFLPNLTTYSVPEAIVAITGGSSNGTASNLKPQGGWADSALQVYFGRKAMFDQRTPTRSVPSPTGRANSTNASNPNIGAIAGAAVGGAIVLAAIAFGVWYCLRRRKYGRALSQPHMTAAASELTADSNQKSKLTAVTTFSGSPGYTPNQSSPPYQMSTPVHSGYPVSQSSPYQQNYYPPQMQQAGYGPQHNSPSPPATMHPQHSYFPQKSPPVLYEMPVAMSPGTHQVVQEATQQRAEMNSVSSGGRSRLNPRSLGI